MIKNIRHCIKLILLKLIVFK